MRSPQPRPNLIASLEVTDPVWDAASRTTQEHAIVKITRPTTVLAAAATVATAGAVGIIAAPVSSAEDVVTTTIGSQAKLVDGNVVQGWTITNLRPSSDVIPYPVAGTLWEATATDEAIEGSATPIVSNLNARARSGETYRVLFGVATPQGVNPATLAQGQKTTGKVYFDVTGDSPDAVVYSAGNEDLLAWAQPVTTPQRQGGSQWTPPARGQASPAPAATPATPVPATAPGATPAAAAPAATPVPAAPATTPVPAAPGAPLPASAEAVPGAPLPAGSQGTPLPAGSQGTPLPAGSQGTPLPAGSEGTPAMAPAEGAPVPASTATTPLPASSQGTPATPVTTTTVPPAPPR
jgi:hypothetical protein